MTSQVLGLGLGLAGHVLDSITGHKYLYNKVTYLRAHTGYFTDVTVVCFRLHTSKITRCIVTVIYNEKHTGYNKRSNQWTCLVPIHYHHSAYSLQFKLLL